MATKEFQRFREQRQKQQAEQERKRQIGQQRADKVINVGKQIITGLYNAAHDKTAAAKQKTQQQAQQQAQKQATQSAWQSTIKSKPGDLGKDLKTNVQKIADSRKPKPLNLAPSQVEKVKQYVDSPQYHVDQIKSFDKQYQQRAAEKAAADKLYQEQYDKLPTWRKKIVDFQKTDLWKSIAKADRRASDALGGAIDTGSLGGSYALDKALAKSGLMDQKSKEYFQEQVQRADNPTTSRKIGEFAGYLVPGTVAERGVAITGGAALKSLPKIAQGLIRGTAAGAVEGAAQEGGDVLFRNQKFDPLNVAISAGLGGAFGLGGEISGWARDKLAKDLMNVPVKDAPIIPEVLPPGPQLALPSPQIAGYLPEPAKKTMGLERGPLGEGGVIYGDSLTGPSKAPLGLPEPKPLQYEPGTTVRSERVTRNPYRQQYEELIAEARRRGLDQPRPYTGVTLQEEIESLWSQMAGKDAPSLDKLIELAHIEPRRPNIGPDSIARGRETTRMREVAGLKPLVKSLDDRLIRDAEEVSPAAMPQTVLAKTGASSPIPGAAERPLVSQVGGEPAVAAPEPAAAAAPTMTPREEYVAEYIASNPNVKTDALKSLFKLSDSEVNRIRRLASGESVSSLGRDLTEREQHIVDYIRNKPDVDDKIVSEVFKTTPKKVQQLRQVAKEEATSPKREAAPEPEEAVPPPIDEEVPPPVVEEPAAAAAPPPKGDWFTRFFGKQGVGITPFGSKKSDKALTSRDVIVQDRIKPTDDSLLQRGVDAAKSAHRAMANKFMDFGKGGKNVLEAAYDTARVNELATNISGKEFVTPEGKVVGKGMEAVFDMVPRGKSDDFIDYLIVKDARDRIVDRGERVFDESITVPNPDKTSPKKFIPLNSEEGIAVRMNELESQNDWLEGMSAEWNQFTNNLRKYYGVDEGLISPEQMIALETARPNYIKTNRQFEKGEKPIRNLFASQSAQTFTGLGGPIKRVSPGGSARKIVDPRKTMLESIHAWVNNAMRNRVGQQLYNNLLENPEAYENIAEIVPETAAASGKSLKEINKIMKEEGVDGLLQKLDQEYEIAFNKGNQLNPGKGNVVTVMVEGQPKKVLIKDPDLAAAFVGMNPKQLGIITQIAKKGTDAIKRSATATWAPTFGLTKAVAYDLPTMLINAKGNRAKFLGQYLSAIGSGIVNEVSKVPGMRGPLVDKWGSRNARAFERRGGHISPGLKATREFNKNVSRYKRHPIASIGFLKNLPREVGSGALKTLEALPNVMANSPRIAAMVRSLEDGKVTQDSVRKAMNEAREITVNYAKRGTHSDEVEAFFPYTNASIQAVSKFVDQARKKPGATLTGLVGLVGLPKVLEYMQFHDDEDYKQLTPREKYRNYIVGKNEDGTFKKIPLDPTYGIFGGAVVDMLEHFRDKDPDAFRGISDAFSQAVLPPPAAGAAEGLTQRVGPTESILGKSAAGIGGATSAAPFIDLATNTSFTGAPIVPTKKGKLSPELQATEKTTDLAKFVGGKLKMSPIKVDYLLRAYGGDIARYILPATSEAGGGNFKDAALKNFMTDPVYTNTLADDYYDAVSRYETAEENFSQEDVPYPEWYNEDLAKRVTGKGKSSIAGQLKALSDQKKEITAKTYLSRQEKADQIRDVQMKINEVYADTLEELINAGYKPFRR